MKERMKRMIPWLRRVSSMLFLFIVLSIFVFIFPRFSLPQISWYITGGILFCMHLVDLWSTRRFLRKGVEEGNPIWAFVYKKIGFRLGAIISVIGTTLFILFIWRNIEAPYQFGFLTFYTLIILGNFILPGLK